MSDEKFFIFCFHSNEFDEQKIIILHLHQPRQSLFIDSSVLDLYFETRLCFSEARLSVTSEIYYLKTFIKSCGHIMSLNLDKDFAEFNDS